MTPKTIKQLTAADTEVTAENWAEVKHANRIKTIRAIASELRNDRGRSPEYAMRAGRRYAQLFCK